MDMCIAGVLWAPLAEMWLAENCEETLHVAPPKVTHAKSSGHTGTYSQQHAPL